MVFQLTLHVCSLNKKNLSQKVVLVLNGLRVSFYILIYYFLGFDMFKS
jgi:hypothetical protein